VGRSLPSFLLDMASRVRSGIRAGWMPSRPRSCFRIRRLRSSGKNTGRFGQAFCAGRELDRIRFSSLAERLPDPPNQRLQDHKQHYHGRNEKQRTPTAEPLFRRILRMRIARRFCNYHAEHFTARLVSWIVGKLNFGDTIDKRIYRPVIYDAMRNASLFHILRSCTSCRSLLVILF